MAGNYKGARGSVVGWGTMIKTGRSRVGFPIILYRVGGTCKDYRLRHLIIRRLLLPTTAVGITIVLLQPVFTLCWPFTLSLDSLDRRLFPLAPDYSLSTLGSRCLSSRQLLTDLLQLWLPLLWLRLFSDLWLRLPSHCLKKGLAGPKWEHLPLLFIYAL
jgi:hypothetical protein